MKISERIKEIIETAQFRFGITGHMNERISVGMFCDDQSEWYVWLERPSKNQLDRGEVTRNSAVLVENRIGPRGSGSTLIEALEDLHCDIEATGDDEFPSA